MTDVPQFPPVSLVGAGPGDPGLLTVRGAELLASAEVVVYDYLAPAKLLRYCPQAETIYVGKIASRHALSQDAINALLIEKAKLGQRVVRLKGGDPFVFGRGGEEAAALRAAGLAFEIVPGVTAAIAAAAYAGIPITHRDFNSGFAIVTGHEKEELYQTEDAKERAAGGPAKQAESDIDWATLAKLPAIAFYMGVKALPRISAKLIAAGMDVAVPVAVIQWGTTNRQRTVVGTLASIADDVTREKISSPAIILVSKVVSLRSQLDWFERRPLFGKTVVVTRTRQQVSEMADKLEALGARVIEAPTIDIVPPDDWSAVDAALGSFVTHTPIPDRGGLPRTLEKPDWIIFTSAAGVRLTRERMKQLKLDARALAGIKVAAVGDKTAEAVADAFSIEADCAPARFVAEALAAELHSRGEIAGKRFLLLRADIARPVLVEQLVAYGAAAVRDADVYRTRLASALPPELTATLDAKQVDWVTFTSSSTARNFAALLGDDYVAKLAGVRLASIGPVTSEALRSLGLPIAAEAVVSDVDGLIAALTASGFPEMKSGIGLTTSLPAGP